jgi:hypothetical protein
MQQELIKQAMGLFDTPEKWNLFLELVCRKDSIRDKWFTILKEKANKYFSTEGVVNGWGFKSSGFWNFHWYLSVHGEKSISLWLEAGNFLLYADGSYINIEEAESLLRTERFALIITAFGNNIQELFNGNYFVKEERNFIFDSPDDGNFHYDRLAWYAGNRTEDFLEQIIDKVNRFRKNPEITKLLHELNSETKIAQ